MLTTVASFREPWEAHIFRSRLAAEDIPSMLAHEHHVSAIWPYSTALGGVKVQVPFSWSDAAGAVWGRCQTGEYAAELRAEFGDLDEASCPNCGSQRLRYRTPIRLIIMLVAFYLVCGLIFPPWRAQCRCLACGAGWSR